MTQNSTIAEDLGHLFEVGFNLGILTDIQQNQLNSKFFEVYQRDLQALRFPALHRRLVDRAKVIDPGDRQILAKWSLFFLQKSFLSGFNFFREYREFLFSRGWRRRKLKILYYQCSFCNDNSLGTNPKDKERAFEELLSQFGEIKVDLDRYQQRGEFLNADTLMLLGNGKEFRILSVDLSVFSVRLTEDVRDLNNIEVLRRILRGEIAYLRSKSVFSRLSIDTNETDLLDSTFSPDLARYFTAFKRQDKESSKLIQAASYAHSFYQFLCDRHLLKKTDPVTFNVMGYTDRGVSTMSVSQENLNLLKTCADIYKSKTTDGTIAEARSQVLHRIQRNAAKSFVDGRTFVKSLLSVPPDTITRVTHQERIEGFFNSAGIVPPSLRVKLGLDGAPNLRDAHGMLIDRALRGDDSYLFLTGNPGIGKTTAIVEFLKRHFEEGFLFFYVSPRTQVNLDLFEKFKEQDTGRFCDRRLFCLNTNSALIQNARTRFAVQYLCDARSGDFDDGGVRFLDGNIQREIRLHKGDRFQRVMEDWIQDVGKPNPGVLYSLCEAISIALDGQFSNQIVATVSIQALKKTRQGDTLRHFDRIFKQFYNQREGIVFKDKLKAMSRRVKHLFFAIDEITGDRGGVEFLSRISQILKQYELTHSQHGLNTKIIVADASIVDPGVIQQHLSTRQVEPDKIFFRKADRKPKPLFQDSFSFKGLGATLINTNSYPAHGLNITYKVFIESIKFSEDWRNSLDLSKTNKDEIFNDLKQKLIQANSGQILVYIQNKNRLKELIELLVEDFVNFEPFKDYLEIHANLSELEKSAIQQCKDKVQVVFMTASASRGLSFPKTRSILIDLPRFAIEQNLMEVIQVIYRGRGYYRDGEEVKTLENEDKNITFYLFEPSIYYADDSELSLKESVLNILNILIILKTSIMTRICGAGTLGNQEFMMVPIGGKSVLAAGETFSTEMAGLIRDLNTENRRRKNDKLLQNVLNRLQQLLGQSRIILSPAYGSQSYLSLLDSFGNWFLQAANQSFDRLLDFYSIESSHISGSFLFVPLRDREVVEQYEIRLQQAFKSESNGKLLQQLRSIAASQKYPENLRASVISALNFVRFIKEREHQTQWFEQRSQSFDRYYALPLFVLVAKLEFIDYFSNKTTETDGESWRDLLSAYVRSLYPVDNILPIGTQYEKFPFVLFGSYSLEEMREKRFADGQLLTSHELNVLNLILSH